MSGWGSETWGESLWGGGSGSAALSVFAVTTNDILVETHGPLLMRSIVLVGDATNPSTWKIQRADTNEMIPVISVKVVSSTIVMLHTQLPLPPRTVTLNVSAPGLLDASGEPMPIDPSCSGVTEEAYSTPAIIASNQTQSPTDLANFQTPGAGMISGTLIVQGGDYVTESGSALLRKLIIRRLTALKTDFYHLPTFGVGLRAKSPIPAGDMTSLQALIRQQVLLEPGVSAVRATLVQSANLLMVNLVVTVQATGQKLEIGIPFQTGGSA